MHPLLRPFADAPLVSLASGDTAQPRWPALEHARVLDAYADALVAAKDTARAAEARAEGQRLRALPGSGATPTDLLLGYVGLADAATKALRFDDALAAIGGARRVLVGRESPASLAGLLRAEATIVDCAGDSARALELSDEALRIAPLPTGPLKQPAHVTVALDRIRVLRRAAGAAGVLPDAAARHIESADRLATALVAGGGYAHPMQLPRNFKPGLPGRPWHSFARSDGGHASLRPLRSLLERAADDLREEFKRIAAQGLLLVEQECIHDPSPPVAPPATAAAALSSPLEAAPPRLGSWTYYTVNGHWLRGRDAHGCASGASPVACRLLADAAALRGADGAPLARVLRGGYSALAERGHIRPHCGLTNTQLKMHVGLVTPRTSAGGPCAALTVGNESRPWEAGRVLFFDDSFLHAVTNECDEVGACALWYHGMLRF